MRRRCGPQARPSTSFIGNTIDLPWGEIFKVQNIGQSLEGSILILEIPESYYNFMITQDSQKSAQLYQSFPYLYRLVTDGRTDGQTDTGP